MKKITVKWEVQDGYVGKSRPQQTIIYVGRDIMDEDEWDALSDDEKTELIEEAVREDFDQKIGFYISDYGI